MKALAVFFSAVLMYAAFSVTRGEQQSLAAQKRINLVDGVGGGAAGDIGVGGVGSSSVRQSVSDQHFSDDNDISKAERFLKKAEKKEKKPKNGKTTKKKGKSEDNMEDDNEDDMEDDGVAGAPTVHVVTHAIDTSDIFWSTWREGAEAALGDSGNLKWDAVGYDSSKAAEALETACSSSDAIVVTVPYASGTDDYQKMDDAINRCIFEHQKPVFTANTDTYHNDNVYAFFGMPNYDTGVKCALSILFPSDLDVITGRKVLPETTDFSRTVRIYWDANSNKDEGLRQRYEGLDETLKKYDIEAEKYLPTAQPSCPCVSQYPADVSVGSGEGLRMTIEGQIYDYPPNYGLETCSKHDKTLDPSCSGSNPPPFCDQAWCYVDPSNCANIKPSREGEYIWTDYPGQEWPYSYETCGSTNLYLDFIGASPIGGGAVLPEGDVQTIVLSSNSAPNFEVSAENTLFICGDETYSMPQVPQYGQSPWLQGMSSVSAAAAAARGRAKGTQWKSFKGNAASSSSSSSYNKAGAFGSFDVCLYDKDDNDEPQSGATVQCWDSDNGVDQQIADRGTTQEDGCHTVYYSTSGSWDWAFGDSSYPDIYCQVYYMGATWTTTVMNNHKFDYFQFTLKETIPEPSKVTVCVQSRTFNLENVVGAHVQCYDNDNNGLGAEIGENGMTGENGCYTAEYDATLVGDSWQLYGREPDVYCDIGYLGEGGQDAGEGWKTSRNEGVNLNDPNFRFSPVVVETRFRSKIKEDLSTYGKAIVNMFERYSVKVGDTWDVFSDAEFGNDWIIQHPPPEYIGKVQTELPVTERCDITKSIAGCTEFGMYECETDATCKSKEICDNTDLYGCTDSKSDTFFGKGECKPVRAANDAKMCVGHSDFLYDIMYEHIIEATEFVDVTSLDSPTTGPFGVMFRKAVLYLHSKDIPITIKFMFGSTPSINENPIKILEDIFDDAAREELEDTKLTIFAGTYRTERYLNFSWNHGKIIAIDGKTVLTGGTNYYPEDYLQEDPVFDLDIIVSNGPAGGAHEYAARLWRPVCDWTWGGAGLSHVEAAQLKNGEAVYTSGSFITTGSWVCPPTKIVAANNYETPDADKQMVIQAARLGQLAFDQGNGIENGQITSDLAKFAMIETAEETVYFSQQDMLPLILDGAASIAGNSGYESGEVTGMTAASFDDTWRTIGALARAITRGVKVSIMVSAPCAWAARDPDVEQTRNQFNCPNNGGSGPGYDYWNNVFTTNKSKWPDPRAEDLMYAHISRSRSVQGAEDHEAVVGDRRRLSYGYGWTLDNIADWIFAYFAIVENRRDENPSTLSANQVADLICESVTIAHVRLNKDNDTYLRGEGKAGGQIGNHAKIIMVDEKLFYIGSDNAYGGGLAEFGLIIDDETKTKTLVEEYWSNLWTEAQGVNMTGTVSGGSNCTWRKDHYEAFGWSGTF